MITKSSKYITIYDLQNCESQNYFKGASIYVSIPNIFIQIVVIDAHQITKTSKVPRFLQINL